MSRDVAKNRTVINPGQAAYLKPWATPAHAEATPVSAKAQPKAERAGLGLGMRKTLIAEYAAKTAIMKSVSMVMGSESCMSRL